MEIVDTLYNLAGQSCTYTAQDGTRKYLVHRMEYGIAWIWPMNPGGIPTDHIASAREFTPTAVFEAIAAL